MFAHRRGIRLSVWCLLYTNLVVSSQEPAPPPAISCLGRAWGVPTDAHETAHTAASAALCRIGMPDGHGRRQSDHSGTPGNARQRANEHHYIHHLRAGDQGRMVTGHPSPDGRCRSTGCDYEKQPATARRNPGCASMPREQYGYCQLRDFGHFRPRRDVGHFLTIGPGDGWSFAQPVSPPLRGDLSPGGVGYIVCRYIPLPARTSRELSCRCRGAERVETGKALFNA